MIPLDPMLLDAFRYSHVKTAEVLVYDEAQKLVGEPVKISEGSVKADRNQRARRSLDCVVPLTQWESIPTLDVKSSRLEIRMGYDLGDRKITVPIGVFRVESLRRNNAGALAVAGTSLEAYVIDNRFYDTVVAMTPEGVNVIDEIKHHVEDSVPGTVKWDITPGAAAESKTLTPADIAGNRDRWELIESLAFIIDCDVYCAPDGRFRIAKRPLAVDAVPVWRLNEGDDGVLIQMNNQVTREQTYNGVLAMGQNSSDDIPPWSAYVLDTDPASPTLWGGPFGKKLYVYEHENLVSKAICENKAKELLLYFKSEDRMLDMSAVPNPALEPDDVVQVTMLDDTLEVHRFVSMTIPLGMGAWTADTLSNKSHKDLDPNAPTGGP